MRIGVIGGGSIGLLVSSYLCEEHDVTIYVRSKSQKLRLNNHGLYLSDIVTPFTVRALQLNEIEEADCYIICVKQYHLAEVMPVIMRLRKHIPLLFLQNGMEHIEHLKSIKSPIFVGVVEHGALKKTNHHVHHTGKGEIKLAVYQGDRLQLSNLVNSLHQPKFPFLMENEWNRLLVDKLIVNAVINPLTTLFDVSNGHILTNPYIRNLAKKLCHEASLTLHLNDAKQWARIQKIAYQTKDNISSMLSDIRKGQQTENEAISGFLIKTNQKSIPYTSFIYESIKALEIKKRIERHDD